MKERETEGGAVRLRVTITGRHLRYLGTLSRRLGHGTTTRTAGELLRGVLDILAGKSRTGNADDDNEIADLFRDYMDGGGV